MTYKELLRRVSAAVLSAAMIVSSAPNIAFAEEYASEEILTEVSEESYEEFDESTSPEAAAVQEDMLEDSSLEADMAEGYFEDLTILDETDPGMFYGQEEDGIVLEETVIGEETEADEIIESVETEGLFAAEDNEDPEESSGYVLMNIPYAKFYEAELGEGAAAVDAVSSSTLNKPRTGSLAGGSYHKDAAGSDISGVVYPVFVSDMAQVQDYVQVTDETSVSITVSNRGKETTTVYAGKDALFENEDYAYYKLAEKPERYKTMTVAEDGTVSFSAVSGRAQTGEEITGEVSMGGSHADIEISLNGMSGIDQNTQVSGVVLTDDNGTKYGLRHIANLWRGTEIGWNLDDLDLAGRTIKNVRYITKDAVIDYPTEIAVEEVLFAEMNVPYEVFYDQIVGRQAAVKPDVDAFSSATAKKSAYFETGLKNDEQVCYPICYGDEQTLKGIRFPVMISKADYETYSVLADAADYHCMKMIGRPLYYVKAETTEGALTFGRISARAKTLEDAAVSLETGSKHGDFMLTVEGIQDYIPEGESTDFAVYGAVMTSSDGKTYVLRHLENLYYKHFNEIAFSTVSDTNEKGQTVRPQLFADLMGNSITAIDYYTNTGVYHINCDVYVPRHMSVTYTDGVEEEELFADAVSAVWEGDATPAYGEEDPVREGYGFYGWDPQVSETVTEDVTYTAVWVSKEDEAVTAVADQIAALPKEPALEDKEAVEKARSAYEALDEQQKEQIPQALVDTLEAAENAVKAAQEAADKDAADAVTKQLNALNEQAGLSDKAAVEAAQKAYDALTEAQKALVSKEAVDKLAKAKESLEKAEKKAAEKKAAEKAAAGPAVGTTLTSGKLKYAVTASGKKAVNGAAAVTGTVTVIGYAKAGSKKSETKVTIPDQITVGGIRYNVTAIGSQAFKGSKKLKKVTVGANITTIGSEAFRNCKKLKKMVIKSSVLKSIGSKAFSKAGSSNYKKLTVKVPKAQLKAYKKLLKKAKLSKKAKVKK